MVMVDKFKARGAIFALVILANGQWAMTIDRDSKFDAVHEVVTDQPKLHFENCKRYYDIR